MQPLLVILSFFGVAGSNVVDTTETPSNVGPCILLDYKSSLKLVITFNDSLSNVIYNFFKWILFAVTQLAGTFQQILLYCLWLFQMRHTFFIVFTISIIIDDISSIRIVRSHIFDSKQFKSMHAMEKNHIASAAQNANVNGIANERLNKWNVTVIKIGFVFAY